MAGHRRRIRSTRDQSVGGATVKRLTAWQDYLVPYRLLRQCVPPAVAWAALGLLSEKLLTYADLERAVHRRLRRTGGGEQSGVVKGPAEHRAGLEHFGLRWIDASKTEEDGVADGVGDA